MCIMVTLKGLVVVNLDMFPLKVGVVTEQRQSTQISFCSSISNKHPHPASAIFKLSENRLFPDSNDTSLSLQTVYITISSATHNISGTHPAVPLTGSLYFILFSHFSLRTS